LRETSKVRQTPVTEAEIVQLKSPMAEKYGGYFERKVSDETYEKGFGKLSVEMAPMIDNLMAKNVSLDAFGTSIERYSQVIIKFIESARSYVSGRFFPLRVTCLVRFICCIKKRKHPMKP
jgi:hypothetical protein